MKNFLDFFSEIFIYLRNTINFLDFDLGKFGKISGIPVMIGFIFSKLGFFVINLFYSGPEGQKEALRPIINKKNSYVLKLKKSGYCKKFVYYQYQTDLVRSLMLLIVSIIACLIFFQKT